MSDHTWWTPARRKMYGRQTPNGITCQSCGHDVCQCSPRTATIGEHVDAVLAAKDAEIERLRAEVATLRNQLANALDSLKYEHDQRLQIERAYALADTLLRDVREWHRCPWKHGASVEVIDLQLHAAWIARIDAALKEPL